MAEQGPISPEEARRLTDEWMNKLSSSEATKKMKAELSKWVVPIL